MNYKKTWFGWLNFTVGTLFMSVFIFTLLVSLFEFNGLTMFLFNKTWFKASFIVAVATIIVFAGILVIINYIKKKLRIKDEIFNHGICGFIYAVLFLGVLAGGVYLRYQALLDFNVNSVLNQAYYVKVMNFFEGNSSGVNDIPVLGFCYLYSFLLKVFGLNVKVLILANYFFQVMGSMFICKAIRHSFGKSGSLCGFSLLMLLSGPIYYASAIGPDSMIFFIVSFIVLLFSLLIRDREEGYMHSNSDVILFIVFGIVFGLLIYINPVFLVLPVYFICRILLLESDERQDKIAINRKLLPSLSLLASTLLGVVSVFGLHSYGHGISIENEISNFVSKVGYSGYLRIFYPDELIIICLVILALCFAAYVNFIFTRRDNISALTVLFIALYAVYAKNIISFDVSIYLVTLLGAIAGIGIKSLLFEGYSGTIKAVEISEPAENGEAGEKEDNQDAEETMSEEECTNESDSVAENETGEDEVISTAEAESESETTVEPYEGYCDDTVIEDTETKKETFVLADLVATDMVNTDEESDIEDSDDFMFLNSEIADADSDDEESAEFAACDEVTESESIAETENESESESESESENSASETEDFVNGIFDVEPADVMKLLEENDDTEDNPDNNSENTSEIISESISESEETSEPEETSESEFELDLNVLFETSETESVSESEEAAPSESDTVSESESDTSDTSESEADSGISESESMSESEEVPETKKFVPIENVIDLPRKHVKKEIGYAFEPGEKYMKFDYEISDDDDFDIP